MRLLAVLMLCALPAQAQRPAQKPPPPIDTTRIKQVFIEAVVEQRPEFVSGPPVEYPPAMRQAGIGGRVVIQAILDTMGLPEPESIQLIEHSDSGFDAAARDFMLHATFRPARLKGRAVRVLVNVPLDFNIRRQVPPPPPPRN